MNNKKIDSWAYHNLTSKSSSISSGRQHYGEIYISWCERSFIKYSRKIYMFIYYSDTQIRRALMCMMSTLWLTKPISVRLRRNQYEALDSNRWFGIGTRITNRLIQAHNSSNRSRSPFYESFDSNRCFGARFKVMWYARQTDITWQEQHSTINEFKQLI